MTRKMEGHHGGTSTGAERIVWMREAGFRETRVEPLVDLPSIAAGIK